MGWGCARCESYDAIALRECTVNNLLEFAKIEPSLHSCLKLQINRKYCLHPFEAKQVQILYKSSHIKEGFYIERENFE